jgi:hypothetical protein
MRIKKSNLIWKFIALEEILKKHHKFNELWFLLEGRNKLNLKRVGMIFDLDENFANYSLNLLPSFGDNVKSAGPP